jgi:hypothetical protein
MPCPCRLCTSRQQCRQLDEVLEHAEAHLRVVGDATPAADAVELVESSSDVSASRDTRTIRLAVTNRLALSW